MSCSLIVFATKLQSESGHFSSYYKWMEESAINNSWGFKALLSENNSFLSLPDTWCPCLPAESTWSAPRFVRRIHHKYLMKKELQNHIQQSLSDNSTCLVFHECFDLRSLRALVRAVGKVRSPSLSVCLLYRRFNKWTDEEFQRYARWSHRLRTLLFPGCFSIATDCEQSIPYFTDCFAQKIQLLPVMPALPEIKKDASVFQSIHCWLPGAMKEDLRRKVTHDLLLSREPEAANVTLLVPEEMVNSASGGVVKRLAVGSTLSREEYLSLFASTDVVLLPYSSKIYSQQTSGVFVEAVTAGKLPLVTGGTWMSGELQRFELPELIVDWSRPGFFSYLTHCLEDRGLRERLRKMQAAYQQEHSVQSLAKCLKQMMPCDSLSY